MAFDPSQHEAAIGFGLFVVSELIGMSKLRSNSVLQLIISAAMRAYPYEPPARENRGPFDRLRGK
jgi:hypothetical protein